MAPQYRPGDIVPRDGLVQCTQFRGTREQVRRDALFPPCDNGGEHPPRRCTWEYVR